MPGSTYYDFVERLASRGVMQGYQCGGKQSHAYHLITAPTSAPATTNTRPDIEDCGQYLLPCLKLRVDANLRFETSETRNQKSEVRSNF